MKTGRNEPRANKSMIGLNLIETGQFEMVDVLKIINSREIFNVSLVAKERLMYFLSIYSKKFSKPLLKNTNRTFYWFQ